MKMTWDYFQIFIQTILHILTTTQRLLGTGTMETAIITTKIRLNSLQIQENLPIRAIIPLMRTRQVDKAIRRRLPRTQGRNLHLLHKNETIGKRVEIHSWVDFSEELYPDGLIVMALLHRCKTLEKNELLSA
jgi:hypothetical protein